MQLIVRKKYLDELIELYGTPDIKCIHPITREQWVFCLDVYKRG